MLSLSNFDYLLPPKKIAQVPISPRDHSKLLLIDRSTSQFEDKHFYDLASLLTPNDVLVVNNTKVFPARLMVEKLGSTKVYELLLEKELSLSPTSTTWEVLTKPGLKLGEQFAIPHTSIVGTCIQVNDYTRVIELPISREELFIILDEWAKTPIPPYIHWNSRDEKSLRTHYQTVYAQKNGAVAAPTAGLHFTPDLLTTLAQRGIQIVEVTLHVGLGTFLPVRVDDVTTHHMHSEWYELTLEAAQALNSAKDLGKRIIAVGTTTIRVLETCAVSANHVAAQTGDTQIFMYPPYKFAFIDSMITNFHMPKSTLLLLISAFSCAPNTKKDGTPLEEFSTFLTSLLGKAYLYALSHEYRFYSFGDAMWIT